MAKQLAREVLVVPVHCHKLPNDLPISHVYERISRLIHLDRAFKRQGVQAAFQLLGFIFIGQLEILGVSQMFPRLRTYAMALT